MAAVTPVDTSPAGTLRRAAAKLRRLTGDLGDNRGPWYVGRTKPYPQTISNIGVPYLVATTYDEPADRTVTADYIAAMHPGVAVALALWLDDAARDAVEIGPDPYAVGMARAVLGEQR